MLGSVLIPDEIHFHPKCFHLSCQLLFRVLCQVLFVNFSCFIIMMIYFYFSFFLDFSNNLINNFLYIFCFNLINCCFIIDYLILYLYVILSFKKFYFILIIFTIFWLMMILFQIMIFNFHFSILILTIV